VAIKKKEQIQKSKLSEILTKEYRYENLILGLFAMISMTLSVMLLGGTLTIDPSFPFLGTPPGDKIFAGALLAISLFGLILVLYPFFAPSWPELKKISWPKWAVFLDAALRVFVFTILLTALLFFFDMAVVEIFERLQLGS